MQSVLISNPFVHIGSHFQTITISAEFLFCRQLSPFVNLLQSSSRFCQTVLCAFSRGEPSLSADQTHYTVRWCIAQTSGSFVATLEHNTWAMIDGQWSMNDRHWVICGNNLNPRVMKSSLGNDLWAKEWQQLNSMIYWQQAIGDECFLAMALGHLRQKQWKYQKAMCNVQCIAANWGEGCTYRVFQKPFF